jgi:ribose transport system ATP-binding protein
LSAARGVNVTPQNLVKEVRALSGGNQQKIALGKWLVADTKLLLMYDPTRGVDVATKAEIFAMMQEMAEAGKSILFYSTDIEELLGVSDRIVVLYRGVKAAELSQSEMTRDRVLTAMLGVARDDSVSMPVQAPEAAL